MNNLTTSSNLNKKKQFLLTNEQFFITAVSIWCELTQEQLRKYKSILDWSDIAANGSIKWNTDIVDEFKDKLFTSDDMEFCVNYELPWSVEFVQRYEDLWNWYYIAQNSLVMDNMEIRAHFNTRLYPYIEEFGGCCNEEYNPSSSFGQVTTHELKSDLDFLNSYQELQFQYPEEILKATRINWLRLSQNSLLPWSANLIEQHIDNWNWSELSRNESIPWDLGLMKKFEHKIDWTVDLPDEEGNRCSTGSSISSNGAIKWDNELLSAFENKLNWVDISISQNAKWDIDLLQKFNGFWEYKTLSLNKLMWDSVFPEFYKEENLIPLLDLIIEKKHSSV